GGDRGKKISDFSEPNSGSEPLNQTTATYSEKSPSAAVPIEASACNEKEGIMIVILMIIVLMIVLAMCALACRASTKVLELENRLLEAEAEPRQLADLGEIPELRDARRLASGIALPLRHGM